MNFLSLFARTLQPSDLPTRGLVLVFGAVATGKDTAILQPLINAYAAQGREVYVIDPRHRLRAPTQPAATGPAVTLINEAHRFFGHGTFASKDHELAAGIIREVASESPALYVLAFQSVLAIDPDWRPSFFTHVAAEIVLRCTDRETKDHVADRQLQPFAGLLKRPFPALHQLAMHHHAPLPWTQAVICTRTNAADLHDAPHWRCTLKRLRIHHLPVALPASPTNRSP